MTIFKKNPKNIIDSLRIIILYYTIIGYFPFHLHQSTNGKLIRTISMYGLISTILNIIIYFTMIFIVFLQYDLKMDLFDTLLSDYFTNTVHVLCFVNTIMTFFRIITYNNNFCTIFHKLIKLENRLKCIDDVVIQKSLKKIYNLSFFVVIFISIMNLVVMLHIIFYFSRFKGISSVLEIIVYSTVIMLPFIYICLEITIFILLLILNKYFCDVLNNILIIELL